MSWNLLGQSTVTCFVSSSLGDDNNDGLTEETALKSISKGLVNGDVILLKSSDTFYERNLTVSGKTLSRYGEGKNPVICGFKRIIVPKWESVGDKIWRLDLVEDNFFGVVLNEPSRSNNICALYDYLNDKVHGRKVLKRNEAKEDWDFWQTEHLKSTKSEDYNELFLYLTTNPNVFSLELSVYDVALKVGNSTVDGIDIIGFGFGISANSNTTIRNCKLDIIGGRIIPEDNSYVCYGNGIEFYVGGVTNIEDCLVENCVISRCYDCGITIQGTNGTTATPRNIHIKNNLIVECCQGWEDFLRNNPDVMYENCVF